MDGPSHQLAAIMFTDIVGYSAIMGSDEELALSILAKNRQIHAEQITNFNGHLLKEIGDGNLIHFNSALDAVQCAIRIQESARQSVQSKLRIGIHLGEVVLQANDAFGDGVNIASRIQELTDPGGIYISDAVQKAIRNSSSVKAQYLDEVNLKNIDYPIKLYAIKESFLPPPERSRIRDITNNRTIYSQVLKSKYSQFVVFLVILAGAIGFWWLAQQRPEELRIAILPIDNLSQAEEAQYISAGIHGAMIDELSKINKLIVTSRTSSNKYGGNENSIPEIAAELKVSLVLESELIEIRDSVRIKVRLIQALPEEKQIWRKEYFRPVKEILGIYGDLAIGISEATEIKVSNEEKSKLITIKEVNPDAYQAYITGMGYLYKFTPNSINKALQYFDLSLSKDKEYAPAYTGIALAWGVRIQFGYASKKEAKSKIRSALDKAVFLDNSLAAVHYNLAVSNAWFFWNWDEADLEFRKTIQIAPHHAEARAYYAFYLDFMHRYDESKIHADESINLDPDNLTIATLYAMHLNHNRKYDEAINLLNEILSIDPEYVMALSTLWTVYHNNKQYDKAMNTAKLLYSVKKENEVVDLLINTHIDFGYEVAMEKIADAFIDKSDTSYVTPWQITTLYARANNTEKALDWLEKAYKAEDPNVPHISTDPIFDNLRETDRFQKLLRKMNLPRQ